MTCDRYSIQAMLTSMDRRLARRNARIEELEACLHQANYLLLRVWLEHSDVAVDSATKTLYRFAIDPEEHEMKDVMEHLRDAGIVTASGMIRLFDDAEDAANE